MPTGMSGDNGGEITTKFYGLRTKARRSRRFYDLKKNDSSRTTRTARATSPHADPSHPPSTNRAIGIRRTSATNHPDRPGRVVADVGAAAAVEDRWQEDNPADRQPRSAETPHLSVEGFEGPLDFLLEMVRRHQLDLSRLSIVALTDQLVAALEGSLVRLERRTDWLVMASELLRLRAQLLAPASPQAAEGAAAEADRRLGQLEELAVMKAAAAWLAARPQLGQDVFARGNQMRAAAGPRAETLVAFLEATLAWLEPRPEPRGEEPPVYRPSPPDVWTLPEALARLRDALRSEPGGGELWRLGLPRLSEATPLRRRSAAASTFLAGLELAGQEEVTLHQDHDFGQITVQLVSPHSAAA